MHPARALGENLSAKCLVGLARPSTRPDSPAIRSARPIRPALAQLIQRRAQLTQRIQQSVQLSPLVKINAWFVLCLSRSVIL
jgi:hypothetical protein